MIFSSSWKGQRKNADVDRPRGAFDNDDDFYGSNEHFNFGGKRKDLQAPPTHNIRPDFEKVRRRHELVNCVAYILFASCF